MKFLYIDDVETIDYYSFEGEKYTSYVGECSLCGLIITKSPPDDKWKLVDGKTFEEHLTEEHHINHD